MPYRLLDKAIQLAARWHAGEDRDGANALPYIVHPIEVLINLRNVGEVTDETMLCAAALHDVVEETDATLEDIGDSMGKAVRDLVEELTRVEPKKSETRGMDKDAIWRMRADLLLAEIAEMSPAAQTVKLADRLSNIRDAKRTKPADKRDRYIGQTRRILETVPRERNPALWDAIAAELPEGP